MPVGFYRSGLGRTQEWFMSGKRIDWKSKRIHSELICIALFGKCLDSLVHLDKSFQVDEFVSIAVIEHSSLHKSYYSVIVRQITWEIIH